MPSNNSAFAVYSARAEGSAPHRFKELEMLRNFLNVHITEKILLITIRLVGTRIKVEIIQKFDEAR